MSETFHQIADGPMGSVSRIGAMVRRHFYLLRGSGPRILELCYWPVVQVTMWGFMTQFLAGQTSYIAQAFGVLMAAVLLWDAMFRSNLGIALSFLEEMWSRNLGHLFVSPLRPWEMVTSMMVMSILRTTIGVAPATVLALWFFGFSIYSLGWPLIGFYFNLIFMGWVFGLFVSGMILRYGLSAESLAWLLAFGVAPITGIYYPVSVLPDWLQVIAWILPSTHVFEGMRAIMIDQTFRADLMINALVLNAVLVSVSMWFFLRMFRLARRDGKLLQMGE